MEFGTFSYNQARRGVPESQLYDEMLEQVELSESLGFDGAWFAEHHLADYSVMPSPNLVIAALARRTKRLRLGALVNVLPLHQPLRFAEEIAMLDVLTGGRLDVGIGRGVPKDYTQYGLGQDTVQDRFIEAADILVGTLSQEHFTYESEYWSYRDVTVRPRPIQQPHPPIFYGASTASLPMIVSRGWHLAQLRGALEDLVPRFELFRQLRQEAGLPADEGRAMVIRPIFVTDTDQEAWDQVTPAILRFWQVARDNHISDDDLRPEDLPTITARTNGFKGGATLEDMDRMSMVLVGSPSTVARKVIDIARTAAPTTLIGEFSISTLAHSQVCRSLELFSREVMPRVQAELAEHPATVAG